MNVDATVASLDVVNSPFPETPVATLSSNDIQFKPQCPFMFQQEYVSDDTAEAVESEGGRADQLVIAAEERVSLRPGNTRRRNHRSGL